MPTLTVDVRKDDNGRIHASVLSDGKAWIEQPYNPNDGKPWKTLTQAREWCEWWITDYTEQMNRPVDEPI